MQSEQSYPNAISNRRIVRTLHRTDTMQVNIGGSIGSAGSSLSHGTLMEEESTPSPELYNSRSTSSLESNREEQMSVDGLVIREAMPSEKESATETALAHPTRDQGSAQSSKEKNEKSSKQNVGEHLTHSDQSEKASTEKAEYDAQSKEQESSLATNNGETKIRTETEPNATQSNELRHENVPSSSEESKDQIIKSAEEAASKESSSSETNDKRRSSPMETLSNQSKEEPVKANTSSAGPEDQTIAHDPDDKIHTPSSEKNEDGPSSPSEMDVKVIIMNITQKMLSILCDSQ